jgi:hypothetical protein
MTYEVKLWTHQGHRIVWALVRTGERKPLETVGHTSSINPPAVLAIKAAQLNSTETGK